MSVARVWLVLAATAFVLNGCGPSSIKEGDTVSGTGTVIYLDFEGGFFGIECDNGEGYEADLEPEFKKDGLRVRFSGRLRHDLYSLRQWGHILGLTYIEVIE